MRLTRILNEAAKAGNVILFLEDIETILGGHPTGREGGDRRVVGTVDAAGLLSRFLASNSLQIIATTTYDAYHQRIENNSQLLGQFEKVEVGEPTLAETELITLDGAMAIEREYRIIVTYAAVKEVVKLADRYLHDAPFPEKALDLLEEVAVFVARQSGEHIMLPSHVQTIVHRKTDIPVSEATHEEREVLLALEDRLHQRVVNQKEAIAAVADSLRRARAGLKERGRPIGTFLFLGPTGVGKTETAKAVAEAYFGSERHMIRLDMNEFVQPESATALQERLTTWAREDPYTLILLDEIEKAHPKVTNLLLQALDEGQMADASGRTVDLTNTIMVATSNAGAEQIRQAIATGAWRTEYGESQYASLKARLLDYIQKERIFSPEFLNRFDAVVLFRPLTLAEIAQVVELMVNRLNRQLAEQGIRVKLDPAAVERLAQVGYDPVFGARALRRTLQDRVENVIAKKILSGAVQSGQQVVLSAQDI
jgi:ATP-dependent Clp protease ATP-binding subunit ClpC